MMMIQLTTNLAAVDARVAADWRATTNTALRSATLLIASWFDPKSVRPYISAFIKDSPTHRKGSSVDVAFRFATRVHPVTRSESLRLTDKRILHALLSARFDQSRVQIGLVIENDHLHITTLIPPGVWAFDNPRPSYKSERRLNDASALRRYYPGRLRSLQRLFPLPHITLSDQQLQAMVGK
jgi:hypothetical protein